MLPADAEPCLGWSGVGNGMSWQVSPLRMEATVFNVCVDVVAKDYFLLMLFPNGKR